MKLSLLIIFAAIITLCSCDTVVKKRKNNPNELAYTTADTASGPLAASVELTGNMAEPQLTAQIKLSNSGPENISVDEIALATPEGIRSLPMKGGNVPFPLSAGKDTTMSLKFQPVNDLKLYQLTGMHGSLKPAYTVAISYQSTANANAAPLTLKSQADKDGYSNYSRKPKQQVTGYSFNTKAGFNENEKKYLGTLKLTNQAPFVYLTEQEIAISGLNFRLRSHYQADTLWAEIFVVNHSDFPVKVIPDSLDIITGASAGQGGRKTVSLEKISGSQSDKLMMEKGDRVLIHFKKHVKIAAPATEELAFHIKNAFILSGRKPLFNEDIELMPSVF